ncbi:MAG: hypothetical protein O7D91_12900 [Planctomycetota bacterium]|nr:hypothetical protein [Planctomycetota bacterium]
MRRSLINIGISAFVVLVLCNGCASSRMRSVANPQFKGRQYERILVASRAPHLDQQADAEDIFIKKLSKTDAECLRSLDVIFPGREYTDAELFSTLRQNKVDAMLIVRQTDYYEDEITYSQTYGHLSATTYYHGHFDQTQGYAGGSTTTRTIRKPRVRHQVELYDVASKQVAWMGGSFTKGNAYARFKNLMDALASETRKELLAHGFVVKKE